MARILGIDLGSHSVKVAVLEGSLGRFELDDYHMRLVAQDLDAPPTLDARLAALDALLEDLGGAGGALTSAGFPTEHASVRLIRLPFGDKNKVEQALPFEVENQVPFDLDEMILAPRVIQLEQGDSQVLAAMAPTSTVSNTIDVLAERGADPKVLPVDADVLGRYADDGVQAIIDVGHSRTLMTLCRGGRVLGCRAISSGGAELTRSLAERHGLTWGEAEGHKHVTSVHPLPPKPPDPHEATSIRRRRSPVELEALAAETSAFPAPFRGGEDPTEPPRPAEDSALVRPPAPVQAEWEEETPTAGKAEQPAAEPPRTLRPPLPADPVRMGHYWADRIEIMLRHCVEQREASADRTLDVLFHEYMGNELETVEAIYRLAGVAFDAKSRAALTKYQEDHPRGRFGRVRYDLADFQLDASELRERFRFYTDRFPVRLES